MNDEDYQTYYQTKDGISFQVNNIYNEKRKYRSIEDMVDHLEYENHDLKEYNSQLMNIEEKQKNTIDKLKEELKQVQEKLKEKEDGEKEFLRKNKIKELAKDFISKKLEKCTCFKADKDTKIVFVTIPDIIKDKNEKKEFKEELNRIVNKIEANNINIVFTNEEVSLNKISAENLLSFGLKRNSTALRCVNF